jgi:hypothetical protein
MNLLFQFFGENKYRGADKSFARPGRKQATATEDFSFIYLIYNHKWRNIITIYIKQDWPQMKYSNHQTKYIGK